jgi:two-component system phosphate regulon sensor histidine kinase PhoR
MPKPWKNELWLFLGITLAAGLAGVLSGQPLACLLLALLGYLGWHLYQLASLPGLIRDRNSAGPRPVGLWTEVVDGIRDQHATGHTRTRELTSHLDRFRDTINALPDAVIIMNQDGLIDWSNPVAERLLGIVWPASAGGLLTELAPDPVLREYLDQGEYSQPVIITSPANPQKILSIYIAPLKREANLRLLVASDITAQYHLDTAQRDFFASVSHELRTPLTVIAGLAEQLATGDIEPSSLGRVTELMQQQAGRMSGLVADLLTLSRLEMQEAVPLDEVVQVPDLLTTIAEEARTLSGAAQHVLRLEIESDDGLRGNTKELRTAFSNLVTNAVQHTPQQAEIRIRWQVDALGAHFSVSDSGEGIAARHIPRLTERLYRVDASRSRDTGGTGLGLAIVKHVLEHHGAELEITSRVGGGSTFTCHFPPETVIGHDRA